MKLFIIVAIISTVTFYEGSAYDFTVSTMDSTQHSLQEYAGHKLLITVIPATQTTDDSLFLYRLDSIQGANVDSLTIIAVPSYEDGYNDSLSSSLQLYYHSILDSSIIIAQGMYTHQSSDTLQHPLFNWLTHASGNVHFEQEVGGVGEMYFINGQGQLYGVFGPEAKWNDAIMNNMLQQTTFPNP